MGYIKNKKYMLAWGKVTTPPESRDTSNGNSYTRFSILYDQAEGTNEKGQHDGKFLNIKMWGDPGKDCTLLQKGDHVMVVGYLRSFEMEKDGAPKTYWELVADSVLPTLTTCLNLFPTGEGAAPATDNAAQNGGFEELNDDDGELPF